MLTLGLSASDLGAAHYFYRYTNGDETVLASITIEPLDSLFRATYTRSQITWSVLCDSSGGTKLANFQDRAAKTDLKLSREGDILRITGVRGAEPVDEKIQIDSSPWYQFLPFSLQLFSNTTSRVVQFWAVRPSDLKHAKFRATRDSGEWLRIDGSTWETQKIKITLCGLLARLWQGYYWFRKADNLFARYEGRNSPPASGETVIELIQETSFK
jgi:hypothetical protein